MFNPQQQQQGHYEIEDIADGEDDVETRSSECQTYGMSDSVKYDDKDTKSRECETYGVQGQVNLNNNTFTFFLYYGSPWKNLFYNF